MPIVPVTRKQYRKAMAFVACEDCTYDFATGEGARNCTYGECPNLPEALQLRCPTCYHNFVADDTVPGCGETATCEFALTIVPDRLAVYEEWARTHH
jgi:hypothetical protein